MNELAYSIAKGAESGVALHRRGVGLLLTSGRDRESFLQGQISNDVLQAKRGQWLHACLLNNTGHLLADIRVAQVGDAILLATDLERVSTLKRTLERFVVRERVEFDDAREIYGLVTLRGAEEHVNTVTQIVEETGRGVVGISRIAPASGHWIDLLVPKSTIDEVAGELVTWPGVVDLDQDTADVLRIESGEPAWGAELDETIIPLEAGFSDAISYTKGCYMGQEIIARIHSRGHTNRTLFGFRLGELSGTLQLPVAVRAADGERAGQDVGRLTSVAQSPTFGPIGLGYLRNEYAVPNTTLTVENSTVKAVAIPFGGM